MTHIIRTLMVALGGVLSGVFYIWLALGCTLTLFAPPAESLSPRIICDLIFLSVFLILHSLLAHPPIKRFLNCFIAAANYRAFYVFFAGLSAAMLMGFWTPTGITIWALPLSARVNAAFSLVAFSAFMGLGLWAAFSQLSMKTFVGLEEESGRGQLCTTGWYARVRHPIYFFTFCAWILAPVMTLDRAIFVLTSAVYLSIALRFEERKLIAIFGEEYRRYQETVPALWPRVKLS